MEPLIIDIPGLQELKCLQTIVSNEFTGQQQFKWLSDKLETYVVSRARPFP